MRSYDILSKRDIQYQSLAALVLETSRLNLMFMKHEIPAKIILLCRTDLFERLPGANKNKIRQDSSINLDWYHDTRSPEKSNLIRLVNFRAKLQEPNLYDIFGYFFQDDISGRPAREFLLDLTRHTPRDFIQLLRHIQKFSDKRTLYREQILSGIRSYSIEYFLPEIKDELVGYIEPKTVDLSFSLIGSLRKRDFTFDELVKQSMKDVRFKKIDLQVVMNALFECSAVGNVRNRPTGSTYFTFKFRNRNSSLNLNERILLHRGMWKALNLV